MTVMEQGSQVARETETRYLAATRSIRDLLTREAETTDQLSTLSPAAVEAFRDAGLFWMCLAKELGGGGCTITESIEVVEEVASVDGSIAWSLMANLSETALAGAYLGDEAVDAMFGGRSLGIAAGMFGAAGKAVEVENGLYGGGKYAFGSGMAHADWIGSGMLVMEDGKPRQLPSGAPEIQVAFVPIKQVEIIREWPVTGLIGTGSFDYVVPEQFIGRDYTFERNHNEPRRGSPMFRLGMVPIGSSGHAAVVLGLMRRALQEVAELAAIKKRPGASRVVAEDDVFKHGFMLQEAAYQGARDYTYRAFREAEQAAIAGEPITAAHHARVRQATISVHKVASQVVQFCHLWSGSEAIRSYTAMSRVSRDMAVASQHILADETALAGLAPTLLAEWRAD